MQPRNASCTYDMCRCIHAADRLPTRCAAGGAPAPRRRARRPDCGSAAAGRGSSSSGFTAAGAGAWRHAPAGRGQGGGREGAGLAGGAAARRRPLGAAAHAFHELPARRARAHAGAVGPGVPTDPARLLMRCLVMSCAEVHRRRAFYSVYGAWTSPCSIQKALSRICAWSC